MNNKQITNYNDFMEELYGAHTVHGEKAEPEPRANAKAGKRYVSLDLSAKGKCPICNNPVRTDFEDFMEYTLCEYRYVCDRCGLTSTYAYGNYETYIEEFGWGSTHNTRLTPSEQQQESEEQELVLTLYRKMIVTGAELTEAENAQLDALALLIEKRYNGETGEPITPQAIQ